jgi:hypothetical protein
MSRNTSVASLEDGDRRARTYLHIAPQTHRAHFNEDINVLFCP